MLLRYAAEHGYTVQAVYIDEDYSGADRHRPAFNRMLAAAERREFDVILAKTQSRFTRDMELVEKYLHGNLPSGGYALSRWWTMSTRRTAQEKRPARSTG